MRLLFKIIILLIISNVSKVLSIEPFSCLAVIGGLSAAYYKWNHCSANECCDKPNDSKAFFRRNPNSWIDYELSELENNLQARLYGQHLVKNIITKSIRKHLNNEKPNKALVLSFHGWTGGGKNYVSQILAESIYRKYRESLKSHFVHHIISTHLLGDNKTHIQIKIKDIVTNGVKLCQRSLFIFDEIDKLSYGIIDIIKPFIDYNSYVDGIDYRKSIFIFLSNTGGSGIAKLTYDFYLKGKERTDITIKDLEPLIGSGAFNEEGGLYKSDIIEKNLIDVFVPFLPLEKKHIELCIIDHLKQYHNKPDPLRYPGIEFIRKVANEMEYFPPDTKLYSRTGCKRVAAKVDVLI